MRSIQARFRTARLFGIASLGVLATSIGCAHKHWSTGSEFASPAPDEYPVEPADVEPPVRFEKYREDANAALVLCDVHDVLPITLRTGLLSTTPAERITVDVVRLAWNRRPQGGLRNVTVGDVIELTSRPRAEGTEGPTLGSIEAGRHYWLVLQGGILGDSPSILAASVAESAAASGAD